MFERAEGRKGSKCLLRSRFVGHGKKHVWQNFVKVIMHFKNMAIHCVANRHKRREGTFMSLLPHPRTQLTNLQFVVGG